MPQNSRAGPELNLEYTGEGARLFWLALKTLFLTIITLGIFRFWMKTRIRRYYWSSIRVAGQPLEFTGTGLEMFLGFLIAVFFLAIYLGALSLFLSFAGIVLFENPAVFQLAATLAVIPLIYYASYRARRYRLSRTRWRGIRFGMDRGALSYMLRALGFALLSILTLGLMLPYMEFKLRKFTVDRSWYGDLRFTQEGHWSGFLKPWLWVMAAMLLIVVGSVGAGMMERPVLLIVAGIGYLAAIIAWVHYNVAALRYAYSHTKLGAAAFFTSRMRTGRIIGIYVVGSLLISIIVGIVLAVFAGIGMGFFFALDLQPLFEKLARGSGDPGPLGDSAAVAGMVFVALIYLFTILFGMVLNEVFIVQPLLQHYVETMTVNGSEELDTAMQRRRDEMVEAEGLADALDVGAAF